MRKSFSGERCDDSSCCTEWMSLASATANWDDSTENTFMTAGHQVGYTFDVNWFKCTVTIQEWITKYKNRDTNLKRTQKESVVSFIPQTNSGQNSWLNPSISTPLLKGMKTSVKCVWSLSPSRLEKPYIKPLVQSNRTIFGHMFLLWMFNKRG